MTALAAVKLGLEPEERGVAKRNHRDACALTLAPASR